MVIDGTGPEIGSRTVKDKDGQPRHRYGCHWNLYGCPRVLHGTYTDHSGYRHLSGLSWINAAVLNFPKQSCWPR
ncbi:hypothetical protein DPMN_026845 [Dreissena polymorpha]|uniref:Uncharacterized protein n=1 Tax=Dreissena polymorpha TaxID=45954 RepID=A0A9D4LRU8_DREPO|nr:hypothetical protein DPMN_026845 [Dreissena polymorpha]